jgi:hypothetical protein
MAKSFLAKGTDEATRRAAYRATIPSLEDHDWNDHPAVIGVDLILDEVIYELQGDRFGMDIYKRDMSHVSPAKWHWGRYYFADAPRYDQVDDGSGSVAEHEARYAKTGDKT